MRFLPLLLVLWLALASASRAAAGIQASVLINPTRSGDWAVLQIRFSTTGPTGDLILRARDARGGLAIERAALPGKVLIPLPLLQPFNLKAADAASPALSWPVDITLLQQGREVEHARVEIPLVLDKDSLRIGFADIEPIDDPVPIWRDFSDKHGTLASVSADDILNGPPLLFAGFDFLILPPDVARRLTPARAQALITTGVQLMAMESPSLAPLVWGRSPRSSAWICPPTPLPRPAVLEPGLANILDMRQSAQPTSCVLWLVALIGPIAVALLLLVRAWTRRGWIVMVASAGTMIALAAAVISYLHASDGGESRSVHWSTTLRMPSTGPLSDAWRLDERFSAHTRVFSGELAAEEPSSTVLLPATASPAEYWALQSTLTLENTRTRLVCALPPRGGTTLSRRTATSRDLLPAFPRTAAERTAFETATHLDLRAAWREEGGYISALDAPADDAGILVNVWAAERKSAETQRSLRAWYDMRFDATHRYLLWDASDQIEFIDFGKEGL